MVFRVGVKRKPTLLVAGEGVDKMGSAALMELASEYLETVRFEPARVIKRRGCAVIVLEPESYP
ncbi:hypothetical protein [Candidatus Hecatella orcuttiae]|jgi:hypothetical protein|uniref:hypothetical protein n=1 Tax=Candidatus Hecatella orcuttiae TaxID=1935119 RepID=UPI002867F255|nr:hypothetical protein [Candidatus Hecatella orcuttiae]